MLAPLQVLGVQVAELLEFQAQQLLALQQIQDLVLVVQGFLVEQAVHL